MSGPGRTMRMPAALLTQLYRSLCSTCLARDLGATLESVHDVEEELLGTFRFVREWWLCGGCGEEDLVLRFVPTWSLWTNGS